MSEQRPTVGRVVHYYGIGGGEPVPAIVAAVDQPEAGWLELRLFPPQQLAWLGDRAVVPDQERRGGGPGWAWPPRAS